MFRSAIKNIYHSSNINKLKPALDRSSTGWVVIRNKVYSGTNNTIFVVPTRDVWNSKPLVDSRPTTLGDGTEVAPSMQIDWNRRNQTFLENGGGKSNLFAKFFDENERRFLFTTVKLEHIEGV